MNAVEQEAQILLAGITIGAVYFVIAHLVGWITGIGRTAYMNRL